MQFVMILIGLLLFVALIAVHEAGHFSMAKLLHINVYEYAIGMGPVLWKKKFGETVYSLRAIPLGGFCNLDGSEDDPQDEEAAAEGAARRADPRDFTNQPAWAKILVLLAGSLFNVLFAIVLITLVYFCTPELHAPLWACFKQSLLLVGITFAGIFEWIAGLFGGASNAGDVAGVVGIVGVIAQQASYGIANLLYLIGMLSINLGIMNLLPIPALDGGRIVFTLLRKITRGRFSEKAEGVCNAVGLVLLLVLMVILIFRDTARLLG